MRALRSDASDAEILDVIRRWAAFLAEGDYAAALEQTDARNHWTPDLLERVIANYGSPEPMSDGSTYRVTPLGSAIGGRPPPRHEVEWNGARGWVWFDLPLNGVWSDLTATFDLERQDGGIVLVLDDVHVHQRPWLSGTRQQPTAFGRG